MSNNKDSSYNEWKVGDICYRKNEKCKIKEIDFNTNPPSLIIEVLSDHHEINTEFSKITKPPNIKQKETAMNEETKKDLAQIQQWFMGLTFVKDEDLKQFIPDILPKLLFKLNNKHLHNKLQSEILQMIQHISSRIQAQPNAHPLIPIKVLIQMLIQHISYYNHNKSFYISSFFLNLTLTFIDMAFKLFYQSLHSTHLSSQNHNQRSSFPKLDLDKDTENDKKNAFITKEVLLSVLELVTFIDKLPNSDQSYKLFHLFVQILPFIKYSNDNIDKNAKVFSTLFKIDFDSLIRKMQNIQREKEEKQSNEQHKILKKGYDDDDVDDNSMDVEQKDDNETESDDDDDDDDEDIEMKENEAKTSQDINIVSKLIKERDLNIKKTAVILLHETPASALAHITMLLHHCSDFLLCRYISTPAKSKKKTAIKPPPGLSQTVHDKISKHYSLCTNQWHLEQQHKSIIDFLYHIGITCEMLSVEQVFIPSLIAANIGNVQYVTQSANRLYAKIKSEANMEHQDIVQKLYKLYLGDTDKNIRETHRRIPCGSTLKLSILQCLSKSNRGCNSFPNAIKVVFDAWFAKTTYAKLKLNGLQFTQQILHYAHDAVPLKKLTPVFKTGLLKLLTTKPNTTDEFVETNAIRNIAYGLLSQLSLIPNASKLFTKNMTILKLYFDRLEIEVDTMTKESILDGLKSLKECFELHLSDDLSQRLLTFLLQRMDQKLTSTRSRVVILQWLNGIFPFNNPEIRIIHLFQLNHNDVHIKEYAKKGLLPRIKRDSTKPQNKHYKLEKYPRFSEFSDIAYERIMKRNCKISEIVMIETIRFAAKCLSGNALIWKQENAENEEKDIEMKDKEENLMLNWLQSNDEVNVFRNDLHYKSLSRQSKYIQHTMNKAFLNGVEKYMHLLLHSIQHFPISQSKNDTLHSIAFQHLLHLICTCYPSFARHKILRTLFETLLLNETHLHLFYQRLLNDSILTRTQCAKLFAMIVYFDNNIIHHKYQAMLFKCVASHLSQRLQMKSRTKSKPNDILKGSLQETIKIDGALKGLSCILSAQLSQRKSGGCISSDMRLISWISTIFLLSSNMDLLHSSCFALSMFGPYDIVNLLNKECLSSGTNMVDSAQLKDTLHVIQMCNNDISDIASLIEYLTLIVNRYNKNQTAIAESAINALSAISRGITNIDHLTNIEEYIVKLRKLPQHDLQFAIGSVWANIIFAAQKDDQHLDAILKQICNDFMCYGNKLARCAAAIWLLCMVRFSGDLQCIQDRLLRIQTAFISSLSDSNEFTVECASKGLAHCYEMARNNNNSAAQNGLLESLMSTLGSKGKNRARVHKDTEIQHKEGSSTYKELCQIANKLNSPKLAYRFLDLASNHAIWNSKRGAAFSLGSLLKISEELSDKMEDIIPILYRYKFDVNPQIRSTMQNLWRSIIGNEDEEALVTKHYDAIMMNVIDGLQSKEWRVRCSTPLAVCALISGKRFREIEKYLALLLKNLFLVIQDINSMVKKSAIQMSQSMINLLRRLCDSEVTPSAHIAATLNILIPYIAIETRAQEVQLLSISMLLAICSAKSGHHLCPHLKHLIRILLIGLSTLEPAALNALAVQDQGEDFSHQIESVRLNLSRNNPLNNALDICIDLIDDIATINSVVPELASIIKGGIGLNSINAACKILNNLSEKRYLHKILKKHSKRLISALCAQIIVTSSPHLRRQYSSVVGHWLRLSKRKSIENVMKLIENLYFNDNVNMNRNDEKRILSAMIASNISRYSLHVIKKYHAGHMLALAFVAVHDLNTDCASLWMKVLDDCGGKQMCLRLHMNETMQIIEKTLLDCVYRRKQSAILSIQYLCELCADDLDSDLLNRLMTQILNALPGKIWDGKTKLFDALKHISTYCHEMMSSELKEKIINCFLIEMQRSTSRSKQQYTIAAINAFAAVVANFKDAVVLDEWMPIMRNLLAQFNAKEAKFVAENTTDDNKKLELRAQHKKDCELLCCTLKCIGNIWNGNENLQSKYVSFVINECYIYYLNSGGTDWIVAVSIYKSIQFFFNRLNIKVLKISMHQNYANLLIRAIMSGFDDLKYAAVRHQALCAAQKIVNKVAIENATLIDAHLINQMKRKVEFMANNDKTPIVVQQAMKFLNDFS